MTCLEFFSCIVVYLYKPGSALICADRRSGFVDHLKPPGKEGRVWEILGEKGVLSKLVVVLCDVLQVGMRLPANIVELHDSASRSADLCQRLELGMSLHVPILAVHPHIRLHRLHLLGQVLNLNTGLSTATLVSGGVNCSFTFYTEENIAGACCWKDSHLFILATSACAQCWW